MGIDQEPEVEVQSFLSANVDRELSSKEFLLNFARLAESGPFHAQLLSHVTLNKFRDDINNRLDHLDEKVDMVLQNLKTPALPVANKEPLKHHVPSESTASTDYHKSTASAEQPHPNTSLTSSNSPGLFAEPALHAISGKIDRVLDIVTEVEDQIDAKLTMITQELQRALHAVRAGGSTEGSTGRLRLDNSATPGLDPAFKPFSNPPNSLSLSPQWGPKCFDTPAPSIKGEDMEQKHAYSGLNLSMGETLSDSILSGWDRPPARSSRSPSPMPSQTPSVRGPGSADGRSTHSQSKFGNPPYATNPFMTDQVMQQITSARAPPRMPPAPGNNFFCSPRTARGMSNLQTMHKEKVQAKHRHDEDGFSIRSSISSQG